MKQRKILVVLSSLVSEENSSFVFVAYAYVASVNQALTLVDTYTHMHSVFFFHLSDIPDFPKSHYAL